MPKAENHAHGLRNLVLMYGGLVLLGITYTIASAMLNQHRASVGFRAAGVIVGVIGFVLWQLATAKFLLMRDEFTRRIHLIALALAFAVAVLCIFTGDLLQRAGFIHSLLLTTIWLMMLLVWCVALIGAGWYYRR